MKPNATHTHLEWKAHLSVTFCDVVTDSVRWQRKTRCVIVLWVFLARCPIFFPWKQQQDTEKALFWLITAATKYTWLSLIASRHINFPFDTFKKPIHFNLNATIRKKTEVGMMNSANDVTTFFERKKNKGKKTKGKNNNKKKLEKTPSHCTHIGQKTMK